MARCSSSSNHGGGAYTPVTLLSFNGGNDGAFPFAGLIADAAGDLFGTTATGGAIRLWHGVRARQPRRRRLHAGHAAQLQRHERGETVVRSVRQRRRGPLRHATCGVVGLARCSSSSNHGGGASTPHDGVSFIGYLGESECRSDRRRRRGFLRHDSSVGACGVGTVFELVRPLRQRHTPTRCSASTAPNGRIRIAGLNADAAGDLFGTTADGGADGDGTVFELVNHGGGPTRRSRCSPSTAPTGRIRMPV